MCNLLLGVPERPLNSQRVARMSADARRFRTTDVNDELKRMSMETVVASG
jgi:hypothetical protein